MAKLTNRLSPAFVSSVTEPGTYPDGLGLYLQVTVGETRDGPSVSKSWLFRYSRNGKAHWLGLGPLRARTLAKARAAAQKAREMLVDGIDPIEVKHAGRKAELLARASSMTFAQCGAEYIAEHSASWTNDKHKKQWATSIDRANASFGKLPVSAIDTDAILKFLQPIWRKTPETASRIRGRVESVLDWSTARKFRQGDNPARWRGHLEHLLRAKPDARHLEAMPVEELSAFMVELRAKEGIAARALEFAILTAARTGEAIGARWVEIDTKAKVWNVPPERMKNGKPHKVPLSAQVLDLLDALPRDGSGVVFPGVKAGQSISDRAMLDVLKSVRSNGFTVHGFRSTFSDWANDLSSYPRDVVEMALAHTIRDKTERAYRRRDAFEKRVGLMRAWAAYCNALVIEGDNVVQIGGARG